MGTCIHSIAMTTTTVTTTKKATLTKATTKALKATKKALGKAASKASGKKMAAAMKKKGVGLFAPKTLSPALAAVCGGKSMPRTEVTKKIWVYIKKNNGRTTKPDSALKAIFPLASLDMLKMPGYIS